MFQPLAYYAAYFSIRATAFSYEMMCMGKERLEYYMAEIRKKGDSASKKELDTLKDCLLYTSTQTQKALEQKKQEEEKHQAEQERNRKNTPLEVQEVLNKGNEFLDKIHRSNDAIPGERCV